MRGLRAFAPTIARGDDGVALLGAVADTSISVFTQSILATCYALDARELRNVDLFTFFYVGNPPGKPAKIAEFRQTPLAMSNVNVTFRAVDGSESGWGQGGVGWGWVGWSGGPHGGQRRAPRRVVLFCAAPSLRGAQRSPPAAFPCSSSPHPPYALLACAGAKEYPQQAQMLVNSGEGPIEGLRYSIRSWGGNFVPTSQLAVGAFNNLQVGPVGGEGSSWLDPMPARLRSSGAAIL